jgi:hypothetical protein
MRRPTAATPGEMESVMKTAARPRRTVTTPSRGVQQWRDDAPPGTTRIAWASEGGRGVARWLILLPVVPQPDEGDEPRWVPPVGLLRELETAPAAFWTQRKDPCYQLRRPLRAPSVRSMLGEDDDRDAGAPRNTIVANDFGHAWNAHHLVVLLVHEGLAEIGEPGDGIDDSHAGDPEVRAIQRLFGDRYDPRLVARGLVRLPPLPDRHREERPGRPVVFALASCQYPADVTDGAPSDHRGDAPASASLKRLSRWLMKSPDDAPSLLVLVGDQVYLDATAGLFDPRTQDDRVRLPYQNLMASPGAQSVFGLLPVAMMLDDHELADNWEPGAAVPRREGTPTTDPRTVRAFLDGGKTAYRRFQRMAGPPLHGSGLWCEFSHAGVPFFLADTRTERGVGPHVEPRRVDNWRQARIMREPQWCALRAFLLKHRDRVAFVASPAMLLPRTLGLQDEPSLALSCDGWDGFPASMHALLALLCEHDMNRVVFLSGDAHTSIIVRATVARDGHQATFWSIHSSGLYSPYPFANDIIENYACDEAFAFEAEDPKGGGGKLKYTCIVDHVRGVPGDGFATLTLTSSGPNRHLLGVCFNRATGDVVCDTVDLPPRRRAGSAGVRYLAALHRP